MNALQLLTAPAAQAIGWALLHLLWQATIVAGILAAVLAILPRDNANARYIASIAALTLVFAMFLGTAVRSYDPAAAAIVAHSQPAQAVSLEPANVPVLIAALATEGWRDRLIGGVTTARQSLPSVVAIWLAGVVLLSTRLLLSWFRARGLMQRNAVEASEHWQRAAARISEALGLTRAIRLLESAAIEVPSVIGSLRPVILLPASTLTGLTPEQIEMVLAHELAHIRRHDFFINLLQAFVETLMFYHPAVWWMSRRVRIERENCCDDLAVAVCGNPLQYARALARLEELRDSGLAVAVAANGGSLLDRVRRIAADRAESTGISSRWAAAVAMLAIVVIVLAVPSLPALAQRDQPVEAAPSVSSIDVVDDHATDVDTETDTDIDVADSGLDVDIETPEVPVTVDVDVDLPDDFDFDAIAPTPMIAPVPDVPPVPPAPRAMLAPVPRVPPVPPTSRPMAAPAPRVPPTPPTPRALPSPAPRPPAPPAPVAIAGNFGYAFASDDDGDDSKDRELRADGKLSVDELIALRAAGVTPEYVSTMRQIFPALTLRGVMHMSAVGVTPEFVREMHGAGIDCDSPREATSLKAVGVSPEFVKDMRAADFEVKTARDATSLRAVGVTPEWVREMRAAGFEVKTARDATSLRAVGVTPEWVREMRAAGFDVKTARDATSLRAVGVTPEWVREMRAAGVKIESAREAAALRAVGVTPEFVKRLAAAGYTNLTARELSRLAAAGVDDDFIRSLEQYRKKK